jgi:hypothetical protein
VSRCKKLSETQNLMPSEVSLLHRVSIYVFHCKFFFCTVVEAELKAMEQRRRFKKYRQW